MVNEAGWERVVRIVLGMVLLVLGVVSAAADPAMQARISAQMAAPDRHEFDLPRDAARKPYETFVYLGVTEGMVALDVGAYAGYTTEMLAAAVGPSGKVYSHNTRRVLERYADGYYERTMKARLADDRLPNVVLHITEYDDFGLDVFTHETARRALRENPTLVHDHQLVAKPFGFFHVMSG